MVMTKSSFTAFPRKKISHEEFRRRRRMEEQKLQSSAAEHDEEQTCTDGNLSTNGSDKQKEPIQLHPQKKISRKRPSRAFTREYLEGIQGCSKKRKLNCNGDSKGENGNSKCDVDKEFGILDSRLPNKSVGMQHSHVRIEPVEDKDDDTSFTRSSSIRDSVPSLQNSDATMNSASVRELEDDIIEIISSDEEGEDEEEEEEEEVDNGDNKNPLNQQMKENEKVGFDDSNNSKSTNNNIDKDKSGLANSVDRSNRHGNNKKESILEANKDFDGDEDSTDVDPHALVCWSCLTSLENEVCQGPGVNNPFIHLHPLLGVSTCSVCADRAYAVEDDVQAILRTTKLKGTNEIPEMEVCSWCANVNDHGTEVLFLCDECPRAFCDQCVSIAHGSGKNGDLVVKSLQNEDASWSCLYCKPTRILKSMKSYLSKENSGSSSLDMSSARDAAKKDGGNGSQEVTDERVEGLLVALSELEDELDETAKMLEVDNIEKKRLELQGKYPDDSSDDLQNKLDTWLEDMHDAHSRCSDAIGILQDDLENAGVDLGAFYQIRSKQMPGFEFQDDEWKTKADSELDKRDKELGNEKGAPIGASGWKGSEENYRDIDELTSSELRDIEDINTAEEAIEQLEHIVQRRLCGPDEKSVSSLIDKSTICNFKKCIAKDDRALKLLNARLKFRSEKEDKKKDICGQEYLSLDRNGNRMRLVCRNARRLMMKRTTQLQGSLPTTCKTITTSSAAINRRSIEHVFGDDSNLYDNSDCILASTRGKKQMIAVVSSLAKRLKPHQIEGIKFMWNNAFDDLTSLLLKGFKANTDACKVKVRGCILAHHMGLGKSLQVVSIIHTLLTHPILVYKTQNLNCQSSRIIQRILLVVPVNTLENWKNEFHKWLIDIPKIFLYDFSSSGKGGRRFLSERWVETGGVMLITSDTFARSIKSDTGESILNRKIFQSPGPDVVIIDEGHMMLKNKNTEISKTLFSMKTSRRIVLTGTPLQNNLMELYQMAHWIRPGCLGAESDFEKNFVSTIMSSLTADASVEDQKLGDNLLKDIFDRIAPYIHRLDSSVLQQDLPPIQQAVIHVRQSTAQMKLYRAFKKFQTTSDSNNFLDQYSKLFTVNNHPGALLFRRKGAMIRIAERSKISSTLDDKLASQDDHGKLKGIKEEEPSMEPQAIMDDKRERPFPKSGVEIITIDDSDDDLEAEERFQENENFTILPRQMQTSCRNSDQEEWWEKASESIPNLTDVENGGKMILLLQILAHSEMLGEKVVVFSQCLKTLDYIESVIKIPNWGGLLPWVKLLNQSGKQFGCWENGRDYLRIDGQTSAFERGILIDQFNRKDARKRKQFYINKQAEENAKLFLLSSRAGSVGINLVAANRVVIFDSSWNPVIDQQALYRCYRYGQEKPVYAYRFLTEGSMEEKVYSRSVNKINLAAIVIDQKDPKRNFTKKELSDILTLDNWVQCDQCEKWRMLPPSLSSADVESLPDKWYCHMNHYDKDRSTCDAKEESKEFMVKFFEEQARLELEGNQKSRLYQKEISNPSSELSSKKQVKDTSCTTKTDNSNSSCPDDEKTRNTKRDEVLAGLLKVEAPTTQKKGKVRAESSQTSHKPLITKYFFHDSLTKPTNIA